MPIEYERSTVSVHHLGKIMSKYFNKLSPPQRQVVEHTKGPMMVLAGAGSGKTRTLVTKISYLLEDLGVSSYKVLALTFSNKAAKEMRDRIAADLSMDTGALQVTTFHSFCARVLRSQAAFLGLGRNFTIFDSSESKAIVKSLLARNGVNKKEISPFEILYYIEELKNQGHYTGKDQAGLSISEAFAARDEEFYQYFLDYEAELHRSNAVDFGGLISGVLQLFEKFPDVKISYQDRYEYLLVDEYQDTNRAQYDLVKILCEKHKNVCVVGDEDQSIYSWRGADIRNILDFEKDFPDVKTLKLEQNYRSSKNIIEAASCVISRNEMRKGKEMWTSNDRGDHVEIVECHNDKTEAEYLASEILKTASKTDTSYNDIAVFYRANAQSRMIEDALRLENIPYRVVGGIKFYDRKEVKDLLSYLRLVVNSKDSLALSRIINTPARGIGATTLRKFEQEAMKENISLWDILEKIVAKPEDFSHIRLSAKVKSSLSHLVDLFNEVKILAADGELPSIIYEKILYESGYWDFLEASKDYEAIARKENLKELASAIKQYDESDVKASLMGFLESVTLDTTGNEEDKKLQGEVALMTIHGAKGLEFNYVFLSGAEENIFPSYKSLENGSMGLEEERRLFYVAMTRAMEKLTITFAEARMLFGQLKFNGPSRFINEIPDKYYAWKKVGQHKSKTNAAQKEDYDFSQEYYPDKDDTVYIQKVAPLKKSKFPTGSEVIHSLYGKGKVLESSGMEKDEKVVIKFSDGTRKKFMVKFTPLVLV